MRDLRVALVKHLHVNTVTLWWRQRRMRSNVRRLAPVP